MTQRIITADEATCQCDRAPAWCFMHRRWGRVMSSPPTRAELEEKALAATVIVQATKIERLSGFLPAVAVVVCPACGVDITADLDDDAEYITRRHSRRAPARIGLGEIVWCDGGIARAGGSRG